MWTAPATSNGHNRNSPEEMALARLRDEVVKIVGHRITDQLLTQASIEFLPDGTTALTLLPSQYDMIINRPGAQMWLKQGWVNLSESDLTFREDQRPVPEKVDMAPKALPLEQTVDPAQETTESPTNSVAPNPEPSSNPTQRLLECLPALAGQLSPSEKYITLIVLLLAAEKEEVVIEIAHLAELAGVTTKWTRTSLRKLARLGILKALSISSKYPMTIRFRVRERPWRFEQVPNLDRSV